MRLRAARKFLDDTLPMAAADATPSPRNHSLYERDLIDGVAASRSSRSEQQPLVLPVAHVFDSASNRLGLGVNLEPVAQVVKDSVSSILGIGSSDRGYPKAWAGPGNIVTSLAPRQASPNIPSSGGVFSRFW